MKKMKKKNKMNTFNNNNEEIKQQIQLNTSNSIREKKFLNSQAVNNNHNDNTCVTNNTS